MHFVTNILLGIIAGVLSFAVLSEYLVVTFDDDDDDDEDSDDIN